MQNAKCKMDGCWAEGPSFSQPTASPGIALGNAANAQHRTAQRANHSSGVPRAIGERLARWADGE
jgi:hypothetical protein